MLRPRRSCGTRGEKRGPRAVPPVYLLVLLVLVPGGGSSSRCGGIESGRPGARLLRRRWSNSSAEPVQCPSPATRALLALTLGALSAPAAAAGPGPSPQIGNFTQSFVWGHIDENVPPVLGNGDIGGLFDPFGGTMYDELPGCTRPIRPGGQRTPPS